MFRTHEIRIDPGFRDLIRPLDEDERKNLRADLLANGNLDPVKVWNGVLVDGHHRYELCRELGLPLKTPVFMDFDNRNQAEIWILRNQIGRRNLDKVVRMEIASELEPRIAEEKKAHRLANMKRSGRSPAR